MKSLEKSWTGAVPALLTAVLWVGCAVEQPKTRCQAAPGSFALKYTKVAGDGACGDIKGDLAGVHSYWRTGEDGTPTVTRGPVAIKTDEVGSLLRKYEQMAESTMVAAVGAFKTESPGADGFCEVENMSPATLKLAAVPSKPNGDAGMTDPLPAVELTLTWSDVKFYVTAAQPGTLFSGRLEYSKTVDGQACSATFDVTGMYPAVSCEGSDLVNGTAMPNGKPDENACNPCPEPEKGRLTGSGVHPLLDVTCDTGTLACVPRSSLPSLRPSLLVCGGG
jgi:hypothetical protein